MTGCDKLQVESKLGACSSGKAKRYLSFKGKQIESRFDSSAPRQQRVKLLDSTLEGVSKISENRKKAINMRLIELTNKNHKSNSNKSSTISANVGETANDSSGDDYQPRQNTVSGDGGLPGIASTDGPLIAEDDQKTDEESSEDNLLGGSKSERKKGRAAEIYGEKKGGTGSKSGKGLKTQNESGGSYGNTRECDLNGNFTSKANNSESNNGNNQTSAPSNSSNSTPNNTPNNTDSNPKPAPPKTLPSDNRKGKVVPPKMPKFAIREADIVNKSRVNWYDETFIDLYEQQKGAVSSFSKREMEIYSHILDIHKSLGFPSELGKLYSGVVKKMAKRYTDLTKIKELCKVALLWSLAKLGYQRRSQSVIASVFHSSIAGITAFDCWFRRFKTRKQLNSLNSSGPGHQHVSVLA